MRLGSFSLAVLLCGFLIAAPLCAQSSDTYRKLLTTPVRTGKMTAPEHLKSYVRDGKIELSLRDAILLTLENNSAIRIEETQIETQKFSLLSAYAPFDPLVEAIADVNRLSSPGYSQLQGVGESTNSTLDSLTQSGSITYTQTFSTGTNIIAGVNSTKSSTNSSFYYFNPYFSSGLSFQFTQPLLKNAGRFANLEPVILARRSLDQSKSAFEAQVNDAILQVITQYWAAVQARGALDVEQKSLDLADVSYKRDKRSLELGALPPLDIYRSESEVAARKVAIIQDNYSLAQAEDALRLTIGANQDPKLKSLPFHLTEKPQPSGDLQMSDADSALKDALEHRPEIDFALKAIENDETSIRFAKNQLKPDLSLTGFYQSNGLGGNQYDLVTGKLIAPGGFGSSFSQLFGFGYPGYGATLTLKLPVKNRAGQGALGTALASRSRDLYSGRQTQEQITHDVSDAVHQLEEARLALTAGTASYDLAEKSLAADQRKFELGAETNFFVLDSQTKLAQAELVLLQTQISYQIALATLEHATGKLLDPYQVKIEEMSK